MFGVFSILFLCMYLVFLYPIKKPAEIKEKEEKAKRSEKFNLQMKKLWGVAQTSMKEKKIIRAEKALLTILKFDEKNAAAYNRLGILYAKEQNYDEAIECFEIAQSLDSNPSSLHNVGLIYIETGAYEKAIMAFQQAISMESQVPSRHIALAKAYEKIGQRKQAIDSLEDAFKLDDSTSTLRLILAIYEEAGDEEKIHETTLRIQKKIEKEALQKAQTPSKKDLRAPRIKPIKTTKVLPKKRSFITQNKNPKTNLLNSSLPSSTTTPKTTSHKKFIR